MIAPDTNNCNVMSQTPITVTYDIKDLFTNLEKKIDDRLDSFEKKIDDRLVLLQKFLRDF